MSYLPSVLLVFVGLVVLVLSLRPILRSVRAFGSASVVVRAGLADEAGLIRARVAALGVAIAERRRIRSDRRHGGERRRAAG